MAEKFDLAVIGSGPGGYVAAIRAAQLGLKTVCIEKETTLGGTCLNVGCIPSKALLTSTEHYSWIQNESEKHGVQVKKVEIDFPQMMQRKTQVVKGLTDGIGFLFNKNKVTSVHGVAKFVSSHMLEVISQNGKQLIEAENILIATGSEPSSLPFIKVDEKTVVSSTGALSLQQIPKTMTVIGAGVIGVELASVYNRLGTEVTIVEMLDHICPAMDEAISKLLLQVLKKQGLKFILGAKITKAEKTTLFMGEEKIASDVVLVAVGRRPYTAGLGLKEIGVETTAKGFVVVDGKFQTTLPNVYAIGDVIEGVMLAHKASEEGIAVVEYLAGLKPHIHYMTIPNIIYTHPEVAAVGFTEEEAKKAGYEIKIGTCAFRAIARARCSGDTEGLVKVVGEAKTDRLLGVHILGSNASELIAEGVVALEKKATLTEIANTSHGHPTLAEGIKEACLNALGRAINF